MEVITPLPKKVKKLCNFHPHSVIFTHTSVIFPRMRVTMTHTSVITTGLNVINTRGVQFQEQNVISVRRV
jgi:hypothetical protein